MSKIAPPPALTDKCITECAIAAHKVHKEYHATAWAKTFAANLLEANNKQWLHMLAQQSISKEERSHWWALVMGAAAEIEDAENCLRDPDAKRTAKSGAAHYRAQAQELYAAPVAQQADRQRVPEAGHREVYQAEDGLTQEQIEAMPWPLRLARRLRRDATMAWPDYDNMELAADELERLHEASELEKLPHCIDGACSECATKPALDFFDLRDRLVAVSDCIAIRDDIAAQHALREVIRMLAAAPEAPAQAGNFVAVTKQTTYGEATAYFPEMPEAPAQASAVDERDRKDAERYRWLRDAMVYSDPHGQLTVAFGHLDHDQIPTAEDFDNGIDAALAQKGGAA